MKNNKGFTLVEIIVVLVILAILAAATIPSMLGFVDQAKAKAATAEARMVYVAAQAYATEKLGMGGEGVNNTSVQNDLNNAVAVNDNGHVLAPYVKGDATGKISGAVVNSDGKVTGLTYTKVGVAPITFNNGTVTFGTPSTSTSPSTT